MREIPDAIWSEAKEVYIELPFACQESGDLSQPLAAGTLIPDRVKLFGKLLAEVSGGSTPIPGETRYFKSVGMGVFDTIAAKTILHEAQMKGLGTRLR